MHAYDALFVPPATTSQHDPEQAHDQAVRKEHSKRLAIMLDEAGLDHAATLVRCAPTDGQWP